MSRVLLFSLMVSPILIYLAWPTSEQKRIALVLGNSDYAHSDHIGSATNNARQMSHSLRRLGFDVIEGTNLSRSGIQSSIQMFAAQMNGADVALLYYSGYVHQESGRTYITPIEANPTKSYQLDFQTIELRSLLIEMANSTGSNLVLFDTCRAILSSANERMSNNKCLPMKRIPIQNRMIISYPTKSPVALTDMQRGTSDFTKSFLENVDREIVNKKHVLLNDILSAVQRDISIKTRPKQHPWNEFSLDRDYSLNVKFAKDFRDTQLTVVSDESMDVKGKIQSKLASSGQSGIALKTSLANPNFSDFPDIKTEENISGTNLSAIAPDDQIKKHHKIIRSIKKSKIRNRVAKESWQKRQLRRMLDSID